MSSLARIDANRRNAQLSTGPRTPEGKSVVRHNPLRHGLLSRAALLPSDDLEAFSAFAGALRADLAPTGAVQELLADQVIAAGWRLRRFTEVDTGAFLAAIAGGLDGGMFTMLGEVTPQLARYGASIERSLFRALGALKTLQNQQTAAAHPATLVCHDVTSPTLPSPPDGCAARPGIRPSDTRVTFDSTASSHRSD